MLAAWAAKPRVARSLILRMSRSGWKVKSKSSMVLWWGRPETCRALVKRRSSLAAVSSPRMRSRKSAYPSWASWARWMRAGAVAARWRRPSVVACAVIRVVTSSLMVVLLWMRGWWPGRRWRAAAGRGSGRGGLAAAGRAGGGFLQVSGQALPFAAFSGGVGLGPVQALPQFGDGVAERVELCLAGGGQSGGAGGVAGLPGLGLRVPGRLGPAGGGGFGAGLGCLGGFHRGDGLGGGCAGLGSGLAGGVGERDLAGQLGADRLDLGLGGLGAGSGGQLRADAAEVAERAFELG